MHARNLLFFLALATTFHHVAFAQTSSTKTNNTSCETPTSTGAELYMSGTPTDMLGPFYLPNSTQTNQIGPADALKNGANRLKVTGRVYSTLEVPCQRLRGVSNVTVEVWYAGEPDAAGNFYQTNQYRGQFQTDDCGFFSYTQTFPALYPTRPILHNHFRLSLGKQELLVTQMYFVGEERGYVNDYSRELQAVALTQDEGTGERTASFDFYVQAPGNPECTAVIVAGQPVEEKSAVVARQPQFAVLVLLAALSFL